MRHGGTAWLGLVGAAALAQAPSYETRQQVQRSLVQVSAFDCEGGGSRKGSGFALEQPGQIVTAHHVVGGCKGFNVRYEGVPATGHRERRATLAKVVAAGDLGLLRVEAPPPVPVLRLAAAPPSRDHTFAGFGYGLGVQTAGDKAVRFSSGATKLRDILPPAAAQELADGSRVALDAEVLRLDAPLEPGMSGGPIVNGAGEVVGVVAGGLRAGASTASWGWPGEGVRRLLVSSEALHQPLRNTGLFYSEQDFTQVSRALAQNRRLRCGELEFTDTGVRPLAELMRGADDAPRLSYLMSLSRESPQALGSLQFQVWVHTPSGATALVPQGYALTSQGPNQACVARSTRGPFELLVWGANLAGEQQANQRRHEFEQGVIAPRLPRYFNWSLDTNLSTWAINPATGQPQPMTQFRDNGLMYFERKGMVFAKQPMQFPGQAVPFAHSFHTLVSRQTKFLGVATVNGDLHPGVNACPLPATPTPDCANAMTHLREWTRFVLATQLSTFPVY